MNEFFDLNDRYFASGTPFSVYTVEGDYFRQQPNFASLSSFLNSSKYIDKDEEVSDWSKAFLAYGKETDKSWLDKDGFFKDEATFYRQLLAWLQAAGSEYSSAIKWVDPRCDSDSDERGSCQQELGLRASRISAQTALELTNVGKDRYDTLVALRTEIGSRVPGAFPYAGTFLFWEETGVIQAELVRNLLICGAVIVLIIGLLISEKRSAVRAAHRRAQQASTQHAAAHTQPPPAARWCPAAPAQSPLLPPALPCRAAWTGTRGALRAHSRRRGGRLPALVGGDD